MKKALIILMAALALFSLVSCKEEEEPARPVKVQYDGNTYEFDYVLFATNTDKNFVGFALSTNKDIINMSTTDPATIPGKHLIINIPADAIGNQNPNFSRFYMIFANEGENMFLKTNPDEGSAFGCGVNFDPATGKISNLDLSLDGKIDGKALKLEFHETADFSEVVYSE